MLIHRHCGLNINQHVHTKLWSSLGVQWFLVDAWYLVFDIGLASRQIDLETKTEYIDLQDLWSWQNFKKASDCCFFWRTVLWISSWWSIVLWFWIYSSIDNKEDKGIDPTVFPFSHVGRYTFQKAGGPFPAHGILWFGSLIQDHIMHHGQRQDCLQQWWFPPLMSMNSRKRGLDSDIELRTYIT